MATKKQDDNKKNTATPREKKRPLTGFTHAMQRAVNSDNASDGWSVYGLYVALGQFLYRVGFETQYYVLSVSRGVRAISAIAYKHLKRSILKALSFALRLLKYLTKDFLDPIKRIKSGFIVIRDLVREEARQTGKAHAAKAGFAYFVSGVHRYRHLLSNLLSYLLPIGAAAVFFFTANTMLGYTYALSVSYNGESLGYIANENVYEEAQNQVRGRIKGTDTAKDWQANPDFKLAVASQQQLSTNTSLADSLVRSSSDDILEATGIEVDGELVGVTQNGELLAATLEEIKAKYIDPEKPDLRVEFVKPVALIDGLYFTSSVTDAQSIVAKLTGEVEGQKLYTIEKGDNPQGIAEKNGIPLKDLQALNPEMTQSGYKMPIGSQLLVSRSENFLQVQTVENVSYTEIIGHTTEKNENDEMFKNESKVVQKGQDGERLINADIVRIDGVEVERNILSDEVTAEPVTEIVEVGSKSTYSTSGSSVGSGAFVHPVPNRSYITTRFGQGGHRGMDICAPYGTPIYACDSGTVVEAGYHGSFGNYILINHGNGMTTRYCHCSGLAVTGGTVARGQLIGYVGQTGYASGNHLHLELTVGGRLVNPGPYIGE